MQAMYLAGLPCEKAFRIVVLVKQVVILKSLVLFQCLCFLVGKVLWG